MGRVIVLFLYDMLGALSFGKDYQKAFKTLVEREKGQKLQ